MLTAKLSSYSQEEVDLLIELLEQAKLATSTNTIKNCNRKGDCNHCKFKHVCYDITKMYEYLTLEAKYGYPHCKK